MTLKITNKSDFMKVAFKMSKYFIFTTIIFLSVMTNLMAAEPTVKTPQLDQYLIGGGTYSYTIPDTSPNETFDPQGGTITYEATLEGGAALSTVGITFNISTLVFGGTPNAGTHDIKVTATTAGGSVSDNFILQVGPTTQYLDLTVLPLTENGTLTQVDDQHTLSSTYDFDTTGDYLSSSVTPISNGSNKFTVGVWVNPSTLNTVHYILNQRPTVNAGQYYLCSVRSDGAVNFTVQNVNSSFFTSQTVTGEVVTNQWTHLMFTVDVASRTVEMSVNGTTPNYKTNYHNYVDSSPDPTMSPSTLGVNSVYNASYLLGFEGNISRIKFWDGTDFTAAEMLAEYNAEYAARVQIPDLDNAIEDEYVIVVGDALGYQVPANTFSDPNSGTLTYTAVLDDGNDTALPSWINFDASTQTFTGTSVLGGWDIKVTADNGFGTISDSFRLQVGPTAKYLDLTVSPFAAIGTPTEADDQHTLSSTYDFDNVDDYLSSTVTPVSNGSNKFTVGVWVKNPLNEADYVISQRPTVNAGQYYYCSTRADGSFNFTVQNSDGAYFRSETVAGEILSNQWTHIMITVDVVARSVDFSIGGTTPGYAAGKKNHVVNAPDATMSPSTLAVGTGQDQAYTSGFEGNISRIKFWDGTDFTAEEMLAEYNAEYAARIQIPDLDNAIEDEYVIVVGDALGYQVPANTFSDPNSGTLTYTAVLDDGNDTALPSWISFDVGTQIFTGTSVLGGWEDNGFGTISDSFRLQVGPSAKYLDLTVSPFTENGTPTQADDQHTLSSTYDFDTTGDYLSSSVTPISNGSNKFTIGLWVKPSVLNTVHYVINQTPTVNAGQYYYCSVRSDGAVNFTVQNVNSSFFRSQTVTGVVVTNQWTHLMFTVDVALRTVDMSVNGDTPSYATGKYNDVDLSPDATMSPSTLGVNSAYNASYLLGFEGNISRIKFWDGTDFSAAEMLAEYDAEYAARIQIPDLDNAIEDEYVIVVGDALSYQVPANTFSDPNSGTLTYTAVLDDGNDTALPSWITFTEASQTFTGTSVLGGWDIKVTADNGFGTILCEWAYC